MKLRIIRHRNSIFESNLESFFPDKEVGFIFMDGIDNLFNEAIRNQMALARESGEQVLVFADADTEAKGWGCQKRKAAIEKGSSDHDVSFPYFCIRTISRTEMWRR